MSAQGFSKAKYFSNQEVIPSSEFDNTLMQGTDINSLLESIAEISLNLF